MICDKYYKEQFRLGENVYYHQKPYLRTVYDDGDNINIPVVDDHMIQKTSMDSIISTDQMMQKKKTKVVKEPERFVVLNIKTRKAEMLTQSQFNKMKTVHDYPNKNLFAWDGSRCFLRDTMKYYGCMLVTNPAKIAEILAKNYLNKDTVGTFILYNKSLFENLQFKKKIYKADNTKDLYVYAFV